jgi:acetyltransferase-like isoleucine patch superfamily enzyme
MSRLTRFIKPIFPMGMYRKIRRAIIGRLVFELEGYNVRIQPGPPLVIAEQPTAAFMRVFGQPGDPPVYIGRYCGISETAVMMLGSEHPLDAVTTFDFYWGMRAGEPASGLTNGPIRIGCDVWIGWNSLVMSGVTVGVGAVVAAGAVVTKDVAPFEVVGGIPARHITWRFDEAIREELLHIAWWEWPVEKVVAHIDQLYGRGDAVADFILRHGGKIDGKEFPGACEVCSRLEPQELS